MTDYSQLITSCNILYLLQIVTVTDSIEICDQPSTQVVTVTSTSGSDSVAVPGNIIRLCITTLLLHILWLQSFGLMATLYLLVMHMNS